MAMYEYRKLTTAEREGLVLKRLARGFPPHQPPHPVRGSGSYLVTVACYEHRHHLDSPERRQETLDALFEEFLLEGTQVLAWSVLTNHYHILVETAELDLVGRILRRVHGRTARQWNLENGRQGRKVWYRYTDRAIRSERHYYATVNYIHYNAVKHGLVATAYDWPWSSVHRYLEHHGREWLRDAWVRYPVREYGRQWDDI